MDAMLEDAIEANGFQDDEFTAGSTTSVAAPQAELPKAPSAQQESGATLGAYTEAVKKFTKSASAFIEHVPLLAEAREAYEEATRASTELRRVLDSGDENLRALMTQLEQIAHEDVAAALGVTVNHVGVLLFRARAALQEKLKGVIPTPGRST